MLAKIPEEVFFVCMFGVCFFLMRCPRRAKLCSLQGDSGDVECCGDQDEGLGGTGLQEVGPGKILQQLPNELIFRDDEHSSAV